MRPRFVSIPLIAATLIAGGGPAVADERDAAALEFFESKVRPLLVDNCFNCHSAETNSKGGLRVDDRNGLLAGGNGGPAVVPGDPDGSLLIQAIRHEGPEMPPKKRLTEQEVEILSKWVRDGAAWPADAAASVAPDARDEQYERLRREHWAWQPLTDPTPPAVADGMWPRGDVDRFILARLEAEGLSPSADARRLDLIRRVTFDLTGLPPSAEEVDAFVADDDPEAFARVVDRLLASPGFGDRWGRHWLDVARFGESSGPSRNIPFPHAWRYRDYVVDSLNADKPYDQFIREQVAGDLIPAETPERRDELKVATGFLALGGKDVNQRFKVRFIMDNVDEQIDVVSRSILGLTVSCARCHDHKFDPIPTADYYALAGIFRSTELCAGVRNKMGGGGLDYYDPDNLLLLESGTTATAAPSEDEIEKAKAAVAEAKAEFERLRDSDEGLVKGADGRPRRAAARQAWNKKQAELTALTDPAVRGPVALGVRDAAEVADTEIRLRGEAEKLGLLVPRGYLSVLEVPGAPSIDPARSGRLQLADWLASPANPLTSRVLVNRVWSHLFGRGIVASVDNFGVNGDRPSHPELLDHLASGFVRDGRSVKRLVRSIVLSRAYSLGSSSTPAHLEADPDNRLVWRHAPRRLDAEEIRDTMLATAGDLDPSRPTGSPARELKVIEVRNNGPEAKAVREFAAADRHRSVYLPLMRDLVPTSLQVFDFPEQGFVTGRRESTTVPPQALYLLNDPFVRRQSLGLATRIVARTDLGDRGGTALAYRTVLGRDPTAAEVERAIVYLAEFEAEAVASIDWSESAAEPAKSEASGAVEPARPATPIIDPDQVVPIDEPVAEPVVRAPNPRTEAWASLCQALFASAEFRYLR